MSRCDRMSAEAHTNRVPILWLSNGSGMWDEDWQPQSETCSQSGTMPGTHLSYFYFLFFSFCHVFTNCVSAHLWLCQIYRYPFLHLYIDTAHTVILHTTTAHQGLVFIVFLFRSTFFQFYYTVTFHIYLLLFLIWGCLLKITSARGARNSEIERHRVRSQRLSSSPEA